MKGRLKRPLDLQIVRGSIASKISVEAGIDGNAGASIYPASAEISSVRTDRIGAGRRRRINVRKESVLRAVERGLDGSGGDWEVGRVVNHRIGSRIGRAGD